MSHAKKLIFIFFLCPVIPILSALMLQQGQIDILICALIIVVSGAAHHR